MIVGKFLLLLLLFCIGKFQRAKLDNHSLIEVSLESTARGKPKY